MKHDVYEEVTQRMVVALEAGTIPWRRPWDAAAGQPRNLASLRAYSGINVLLLGLQGRQSPYWLTFRQAQALGGTVRQGEHGTRIIFWKPQTYTAKNEEGEDEERQGLLTRTYTVFNVEQCDGLTVPATTQMRPARHEAVESVEAFVRAIKPAPRILHGGSKAFFSPVRDVVQLPAPESFASYEDYAATRFHELTHWTGHPARLDRATIRDAGLFGDENYSKEELVAEMGSGFLCAQLGIANESTWQNSVAYVQSWLNALRNDRTLVVSAAQQAQKAVAYLSGIGPASAVVAA